MTMKKKILFLTGTRADFGKLKTLIKATIDSGAFEAKIFVTGMHTLALYGNTQNEVLKSFSSENIHVFYNQRLGESMEDILSNTISGLSRFIHEYQPDMLVIHGDRIEALAGAITGAINNILVSHIEGGERSGTIDELIRHSVSKLSHLHFVSNQEAKKRLVQMGERDDSIFVIGSPDIDIMLSEGLPHLSVVRKRYCFDYDEYGIALFHPVTTRLDSLPAQAKIFVDSLIESGKDYLVIFPNNDEGNQFILEEYKRLQSNPRFKVLPSVRFEYFLVFLKYASFMIGNSSAGVREAPIYGVPSIDLGERQNDRAQHESIFHVTHDKTAILTAINKLGRRAHIPFRGVSDFGGGDSASEFMRVINKGLIWDVDPQKYFVDL